MNRKPGIEITHPRTLAVIIIAVAMLWALAGLFLFT
jgi:hypothetical protein